MSEREILAEALRSIKAATNWYFACAGAVSHDDVRAMMSVVKKEIDGVHEIIWPPTPDEIEPSELPLTSDF